MNKKSTQVFCNGEEVMTVGGTQAEYVVDIWSGNHPFFLGKSTAIMTNAGRVSRFGDRFADRGMAALWVASSAQRSAAARRGFIAAIAKHLWCSKR